MENKGLLSVIVPVYNAEKYLKKCIESILNQDYKNLELLLVNDGSKDSSLSICREYEKLDSRVRVFDKPNGGAASARNLGIREAKGEFIGFCDADDFFDLDAYSTLIGIMNAKNLPTIECLSREVGAKNQCINDVNACGLQKIDVETLLKDILTHKGNVSLCTRVTRADYIKDIQIPEGRRVEDFYFTILLLLRIGGTTVFEYPFYNHVSSENSVTRTPSGSIFFDALYFFDKACEKIESTKFNLEEEKKYFLLKNYYLLSISLTKTERKKYKQQIKQIKRHLRTNLTEINSNIYLTRKEKVVLRIARHSFCLTRLLYLLLKN